MRLGLILFFILIISFLYTFLLNRMFSKKRYMKYIPVMITDSFMIYYFITMNSANSEGFEDLGRFIMGMLLLAASLSSLITAIAFDLYHKRMNRIK